MPLPAYALPDLHTVFGFGVAGNFAGHLEQAGEAADFVGVGSATHEAPKGIFPWFAPAAGPGIPEFLEMFPLSSETVVRPVGDHVNLQIEPEVGLLARVEYDESGAPQALHPEAIGAFNDCSIRRPGAKKISHKKNWGGASKGLASTLMAVDDLSPDGPTAGFRLACFLVRDGATHAYGIDSALPDYSYYGDQLLEWIVDRLQHQTGSDETPLEPVGAYLAAAGRPERVLIGIGATRYTALGERTYLEVGDQAVVVVYDGAAHTAEEIEAAVGDGTAEGLELASVLRQVVVAGAAGVGDGGTVGG